MTINSVDSSGWIEFFSSSVHGASFEPAIDATSALVVPTITIFEVFRHVQRVRGDNPAKAAIAVMRRGHVVDLDADLAMAAASIAKAYRLAMADSIILATARAFGATLWTQDADFAGLDGVKYLPKPA